MRDILFRGKRLDNGEWVEGFYTYCTDGDKLSHRIYISFAETYGGETLHPLWLEVDPATVGQYTGLTDKNGKRIFEGDIVKCTNYHGAVEGNVDYSESLFYLACSSGYSDEYLFNCSDIEVIGNIHDKEDRQA